MRLFFLFLLTLVFPLSLSAQTDTIPERPKIGLVLSGGGAKGLAHIGVLKVLEEVGIRPDYITGTSMGSIVGGLYAIGYSADELDSIVRRLDWSLILSDAVPLSEVMPEEKADYHRFHVELDYTREGLRLPGGFVQGYMIYETLARLSLNVAGVHSFDDYPIPFRCVAADIFTGREYVFKEGDFATALRASMSIPTAFAPVKHDGALLVDGGVLNNFPVLLCKEMGADYIIGVNVGWADELKPEDFILPTDVLMAAATIPSLVSIQHSLPYVDLLISPDLKSYSMTSFFDGERIMAQGELAARAKIDLFRGLARHLDSIGIQSATPKQMRPELLRISQVRINGLERTSHRFFMGNLDIEPGAVISPKDLEDAMGRLMGTRYYASVNYQLRPLRDGYLLNVTAVESEQSRVKFSLHYDNEYRAGVITNLTLRNIIARGNRWSTTLDIAESPRLNSSIINYFGERQRTASRLELVVENNKLPFYLDNGSLLGMFKHNYFSLSAGFMSSIGTRWELNAFAMLERTVLKRHTGFSEVFDAGIERFGNRFFSANFSARRNSLNRRFFPTRGGKVDLWYKLYLDVDELYEGSEDAHTLISEFISPTRLPLFSVNGAVEKLVSLSNRWVLTLNGQAGFNSGKLPMTGLSFLGGMPFTNRSNDISFAGLLTRERQVDNYAIAGLKSRFQFMNKVHATVMANVVHSFDGDQDTPGEMLLLKSGKSLWGYGLLLEYDSFLGPIQGGVARNSTDSRFRWYLGFGYSF